jgi:tRNA/rRNA methyltransferase
LILKEGQAKMQSLDEIRIVLVEPAGARNVGSIARVMANMGLQQLVIVNPQCDWVSEEAEHMAVRGRDILTNAQIVYDLPAALVDCRVVVATTHRDIDLPQMPQPPRQALAKLWQVAGEKAILFGREDCGLTNQELDLAQHYLRIPVAENYTSLNLAQAVGICAYELYQLAQADLVPVLPIQKFATADQIDRYFQHLEDLLLKVGYLQTHTTANRMSKLRKLANRATLSEEELALLWGTVKQIDWKLQHPEKEF